VHKYDLCQHQKQFFFERVWRAREREPEREAVGWPTEAGKVVECSITFGSSICAVFIYLFMGQFIYE
jgi:hypothetical protein